MTFNRNEQLALIVLSCALLVGGMVSLVSHYMPGNTPEFEIRKSAVEVPPLTEVGHSVTEIHSLIDLNKATSMELQKLPRIGPKVAQRIIDFRGANGSFKSVEDLTSVQGIGPKTLDQLRPLITVQ